MRELSTILFHVTLGLMAIWPIIALLFQRRRKARITDEWVFLFFILIPPVVFLPTAELLPRKHQPELAFYSLLLEIIAVICLVICQRRLYREGHKPVAVSVLATVAVIGFIVLLLQPETGGQEPSKRTICSNNLKQQALGIHSFAIEKKRFPFPLGDPENAEKVSWRIAVTPFIERNSIKESYRFDQPWNSQSNKKIAEMELPEFLCPLVRQKTDKNNNAFASYSIPIGKNTFFGDGRTHIPWDEKYESQAHTILLVESTGQHIPWAKPHDVNADELPIGINLPGSRKGWSDGLISSLHSTADGSGSQIAFLDGAVYFMAEDTDPEFLRALLLGKLNEDQKAKFEKRYR